MIFNAMSSKKLLFAGVVATVLAFIMPPGALAKLPEPDNIIYGIPREDVVTITLEVSGQPIVSYTMGDNPDAGGFYILRVPMDALEPPESGSARNGEQADIFINDEPAPLASVTLGARGSIHRLDLLFTDIDDDGLPDDWEQQIIDKDSGDAIETIDDVLPGSDFDGDGESNSMEYGNGTNPTNSMSAQRGDVQGDKIIDLADAITSLKVLTQVESIPTIHIEADVNGDARIGMEEMGYILQKISDQR
jgi:hypothetical protein